MLFKLFLLFTLVPIVELALLIELGSHIGSLTTVALVVITGAAGAALARSQGLLVFQRLRSSIGQANRREMPSLMAHLHTSGWTSPADAGYFDRWTWVFRPITTLAATDSQRAQRGDFQTYQPTDY